MKQSQQIKNLFLLIEESKKNYIGRKRKCKWTARLYSYSEVNTTELCNRTCVFCPRHDPEVFPNRNLHMTVKGATTIAEHLGEVQYNGKVSFSGFGENLLNPNFPEIVREFRFYLPTATLECNTNGDKLTKAYIQKLFSAGLDLLYVNLYDGAEQADHFDKLFKELEQTRPNIELIGQMLTTDSYLIIGVE